MADVVGEFGGQRLFRDLRLIVVEVLFIFGIVGGVFVSRFRDHEGVARSVGGGSAVTGGEAGGIGLGFVGKARNGQESQ